jgi:hypothetical protein
MLVDEDDGNVLALGVLLELCLDGGGPRLGIDLEEVGLAGRDVARAGEEEAGDGVVVAYRGYQVSTLQLACSGQLARGEHAGLCRTAWLLV